MRFSLQFSRRASSEGTVKIHATAIFKVLGVTSRTQALIAASRYGLEFMSTESDEK